MEFSLVWNVLDFGVTYFRGRQQENKATIEEYEYQRIANSLVLRIVTSYWRAVSSRLALERANVLLPEMLNTNRKVKGGAKGQGLFKQRPGSCKTELF